MIDLGWLPEQKEVLYLLHRHGACRDRDPELFFPHKGQTVSLAKAICRTCPVIDQCREYALEAGERWGVWGGMSERERRRERRRRLGLAA